MNGLNTLAVWNEAQHRLLLVNDRYDIQKLYYYSDQEIFLFSSELKSIAQYPRIRRQMSLHAGVDLLCLGYLLNDRTLFEDVRLLPPATILSVEQGRVQQQLAAR